MQIEYKNKFITYTGKLSGSTKKLICDIKKCFTPSLANIKNLQTNKANEYIHLADHYKIAQFMFFSQTQVGIYIKMFNYLNKGPTYTFKIIDYTYINQLQNNISERYTKEPLFLVDKDIKLDFMNMHQDVNDVERVISFIKEDENYYFRHYMVRKDGEKVILFEVGPRITMELYKIEEGILEGEILYNKYVQKSEEEIEANRRKIKEKEDLKLERRLEQERNVERKKTRQKENSSESDEITSDE